jgi:hypothetical protein
MRTSDPVLASAEAQPEALDSTGLPHNHRWRIEEQGTPRSNGTCNCGATRFFFNGWNDERDGWHGRLNAGSHLSK